MRWSAHHVPSKSARQPWNLYDAGCAPMSTPARARFDVYELGTAELCRGFRYFHHNESPNEPHVEPPSLTGLAEVRA